MKFGEVLETIADSNNSIVLRVKCAKTEKLKVLKYVRIERYRNKEIEMLRNLRHPNILELEGTTLENGNNYMIFENCLTDLEKLNRDRSFELDTIRKLMFQLMNGLEYIHGNGLIHRDIKPENLLLSENYILKICDFGLSRKIQNNGRMTPQMVTIWYRPIEILFGALTYTSAVDIWSAGMVMAELVEGEPLVKGRTEIEILNQLITVLGTPTTEVWPDLETLPVMQVITLRHQPEDNLAKSVEHATGDALEFLRELLKYDPKQRISAQDAKNHAYFSIS